jgi:hypothetical protein
MRVNFIGMKMYGHSCNDMQNWLQRRNHKAEGSKRTFGWTCSNSKYWQWTPLKAYKDESGNYVIKKDKPTKKNGNPVNVSIKISYGQSRNNETNRWIEMIDSRTQKDVEKRFERKIILVLIIVFIILQFVGVILYFKLFWLKKIIVNKGW